MSKVKLAFALGLLSALALSLTNCGGSYHSPEEGYYLVAANTKIPYWQAAAAGLADAARQLGVRYEMAGPDTYDPQAQHREFQRVLHERIKPSGILVSPADPQLMKADIDQAVGQGIPVITIDSDSPESKRLLFIGTDNYDAGRMGAEVAVKALGGKGKLVVYTMPEQLNLKQRLEGYQEIFRAHPGMQIVQVVDIKGDPRIAFDHTMEIANTGKPAVDGFICLEALACPEVADVLNRNNIHNKTVIAMDTDPRTLNWIQKGMIASTIAQKPYTMAFFGVMVLDDLHHHKPPSLEMNWAQDTRSPIPSFIDTGATLIDKSNVGTYLKSQAQRSGQAP